ncbi:MAG: sigma-54-dependent Fis family transcriptional regulator [Candidatus Latescibacteria bacterium]|nr:sigma-54-dependent Fis family transcriptional regulator [Candidatus Latescibacterota bacterium]
MGYQNLYDVKPNKDGADSSPQPKEATPAILYLSLDGRSCAAVREQLKGIPLIESQSAYHVQQELISKQYSVFVIRCNAVTELEFEMLQYIKEHDLITRVIVSAESGAIDLAVRLMKAGAVDFIMSETPDARLATSILNQSKKTALTTVPRKRSVVRERAAKPASKEQYPLIGHSQAIRDLRAAIQLVAKSRAPVLIMGESGTGKEVVARQIHQFSERTDKQCIALNCAALPSSVIENELFGHEKGAFSGALAKKAGCFELADGGTLLLDEITEMDIDNQAKLLRVLEHKAFRRLGGKDEVTVDVKTIAATNKDIHESIENKQFRHDLYYRLGVIEIEIPPLRERREDIMPLMQFFLHDICEEYKKAPMHFSDEALEILMAYEWPGNVRELRNLIERSVVMCSGEEIGMEQIPARIRKRIQDAVFDSGVVHISPEDQPTNIIPVAGNYSAPAQPQAAPTSSEGQSPNPPGSISIPIGSSSQDAEKILILQTLISAGYNKSKTSRILGVSRKTLHNKINALFPEGIETASAQFLANSGSSQQAG